MQSVGVVKRISPSDAVFVDDRLKDGKRTVFVSVCTRGFRLECVEKEGEKKIKVKRRIHPES